MSPVPPSPRITWALAAGLTLTGCVAPKSGRGIPDTIPTLPVLVHEEVPPLTEVKEGILRVSLEHAVCLALKQNRELRVERFGPVIQGAFEHLERGKFDLEGFAEFGYEEETASETARSTGERFSVEGDDREAVFGLRRSFATGTDVEASVSHGRSVSDRTPEQQEARAGLSLTQALLRGLGPRVNLVDLRQARLATEASLYELRGFVEAVVADTETAYWRYVLARENTVIFERSLDVAQQQLDEVEQRIEVGDLPSNAAAAARAEVARREQALIQARGEAEDRRLRLLRLLNATDANLFERQVDPTTPPRTQHLALTDLDERLALADRVRSDLNEARLRRDQNRLELVRTRNGVLPRLDLFVDLGKTGYAESFGDAFANLDEDTYELSAGLRLSAFLENREARGRHLAAGARSDQAEAAVESLRQLVQLDVRLAWNELERTRRQIEASAVTRSLQEQTLQAEQERFAIGASTSLLLAQAQRDLLASQLAEIGAVVAYRLARVNLYRAEGSLLDRRGVRVEGGNSNI